MQRDELLHTDTACEALQALYELQPLEAHEAASYRGSEDSCLPKEALYPPHDKDHEGITTMPNIILREDANFF